MKEASDGRNTMYIKFPTVTKLTYPFESPPQPQHLRTTSYRSNLNVCSSIKLSLLTKTQSFKIISLPEKNEIMNICTMTMGQKPQEEDSNAQQSPRKKVFSVSKLNSLKLKEGCHSSSFNNPLKVKKQLGSLNKLSIPTAINIDFQQVYTQVSKLIGLSYGVVINNEGYSRIRKGRVESGNNGLLVKQSIKKRLWWNIVNEEVELTEGEGLNLIWTQHTLNNKQISKLIQLNNQSISSQTRKYEQIKPVFNKNFERTFNSLQKIKQLFFTQWEEQPLRIKDWFFKLSHESQYSMSPQFMTLSNHLPNNWEITNKKLLYKNMVEYYRSINVNPHQKVPKTYHLTCFNWQEVIKQIRAETNKWILKPGEFTNRGRGITVFRSTKEALDHILLHPPKTQERTYLLQQYITPTLYQDRKFDIRCYILGVQIQNCLKFYWFEEGYIRTASEKFTLKKVSKSIHLTNDAIQKGMKNYGQHQSANKLSYNEIDKYFLNNTTFNFSSQILPEMKRISRDICHAVGDSNLIGAGAGYSFEVFGLDFLVDEAGKPWLIEVNTNPCLDIGCSLLSRIIPELLQNTWRLVLDVFLPARKIPEYAQHFLLNNKYSLIYSKNRVPLIE